MKGWGKEDSVKEFTTLIQQSRQLWRETGFNPIVVHTATG